MKRFITISAIVLLSLPCLAYRYDHDFKSTPIPRALTLLMTDNPDARINFIYDELEDYATTCRVSTDDLLTAVRKIIGVNAVTVRTKGNTIYVEAIQKGKYHYTGRTVDKEGESVPFATVMMLNPVDSAIVTYGVTDKDGYFTIPCDRRDLLAKISSIGFRTRFEKARAFAMGDIRMEELPIRLNAVTVEGDTEINYPDRTVAIPNTRQKNASIDAVDLLSRLPLPHVKVDPVKGTVETFNGKSISIYFNGIPANKGDMQGMNMRDVKRVEYLDYPKDPRFQGEAHVINFIMQQYEYGGYLKTFANENFIFNSGNVQVNSRFQYKKMCYDLMVMGFYHNTSHSGQEQEETYRLLQKDGKIKEFSRYSSTEGARLKRNQTYATFRATYNSDNVTATSTLSGSIDRRPKNNSHGTVRYFPSDYPLSDYDLIADDKSRFINYSGNYFFKFGGNNSLTFTPQYNYSHTDELSSYMEKGFSPVVNRAYDDTHDLFGMISYFHSFDKHNSIYSFIRSSHETSHTHYTGSVTSYDKSKGTTLGAGVDYTYQNDCLYAKGGIGVTTFWSNVTGIKTKRTHPWADLWIQYTFHKKHTLSLEFHNATWEPSASYLSENVLKANHLMSYTGNPNLVPDRSFDLGLSYNFIPGKKFTFSTYYYMFILANRYVFDYESTPTGILRTIKQPMGRYNQHTIGMNGSLNLFDRSLSLSGTLEDNLCHNGAPYGWTKSHLTFILSGKYYLGNFNFSLYYRAPMGKSEGSKFGKWANYRSSYQLSAGWGDSHWTIRASAINLFRWNGWKGCKITETSRYYDNIVWKIDAADGHAWFNLAVTYTFGFGKKIDQRNELRQQGSASSGILK